MVSDICNSLKLSGGCVIGNMIDKKILQALEGEIRPHLDKIEQADRKHDY